MHTPHAIATITLLALATLTAHAQPVRPGQPPWPRLQQGFEDVEPLAHSLATQPVDLRTPTGFEDVFDLGDGRLARIDGGLIAVFPRSTYTRGSDGTYPTIPPGTIFYLGTPPALGPGPDDVFTSPRHSPPARTLRNAGRGPDRRAAISLAAPAQPATTHAGGRQAGLGEPWRPPPPPSIFTSDRERSRVVGDLLNRARNATR